MQNKDIVKRLIQEASDIPVLEYTENIKKLKENVIDTILKVKRRLGALQSLESMLDLELMLSHDEDSI